MIIQQILDTADISKSELARRLGKSRRAIGMQCKYPNPKNETVIAYAAAAGVALTWDSGVPSIKQ